MVATTVFDIAADDTISVTEEQRLAGLVVLALLAELATLDAGTARGARARVGASAATAGRCLAPVRVRALAWRERDGANPQRSRASALVDLSK